jgi:hypothetical protein
MTTARRVLAVTALFACAALVGPALRWAAFALQPSSPVDPAVVQGIVFALWPAQPFAVIEASTGRFWAGAVAVLANVFVFALVGVVVGTAARRRRILLGLFVAVLALGVTYSLLWAGFDVRYLSWPGMTCAFLLQCLLFAAAAHFGRRGRAEQSVSGPSAAPQ